MNTEFIIDEYGMLKEYVGSEARVVIPRGVSSIGAKSFAKNPYVRSVTVPGSVTRVEYGAFLGCDLLEEVVFEDGVREISYKALAAIPSLKRVFIPDSVNEITYDCFEGSDNVEYNEKDGAKYLGNEKNPYAVLVRIDSSNEVCQVCSGCVLVMDKAADGCEGLSSVSIPPSVRNIGFMAFYGVETLSSVSFSEGLGAIDASAFEGTDIRDLELPSGVREIRRNAFSISSLRRVVLPDSIVSIGEGAFSYNPLAYSEWQGGLYIGSRDNPYLAFMKAKDPEEKEISIHPCAKIIYSAALEGMAQLRSVGLPQGLVEIGGASFSGCSSLESVLLPESLERIGEDAFSECIKLHSVSFPKRKISIDSGAFSGCESLERVEFTASVADNAFDGCEGLAELIVRDGSNIHGDYVFAGCSGLRRVVLPSGFKGRYTESEFEDSDAAVIEYC